MPAATSATNASPHTPKAHITRATITLIARPATRGGSHQAAPPEPIAA
ncbi:hypothetical protein Ate01nite_68750 [Actinoplanes teichomyceticus]|nr:hypothetical protein Ate01nite_68750 [Actinoplanes teichomyceticus]